MASEDARASRAQPEAELLAAGSDTPRVKLLVANVYDSSLSKEVSLEPTHTVHDLKLMLQSAFPSSPAPHHQRLIFRGKQCEEGHQLGHVLRGADLGSRQTMHLVVTRPTEVTPRQAVPRGPVLSPGASPGTPRRSVPAAAHASVTAPAPETGAAAQPERVLLSAAQITQLQQQYQQALREQQQVLQQQQQRYHNLALQAMALTKQSGRAPSSGALSASQQRPLHQPLSQWPAADNFEVATSAATRALGADMPGPANGGRVRDITQATPGVIPEAGFEDEDGRPARHNVDPAPAAMPARVHRGKLFLQLCGVVFVFGADAKDWQLFLLCLGATLVFMYKTGALAILLGEGRENGGIWKAIRAAATVIPESGGFLTDLQVFFCAFFGSLFPPWKPARSPAVIAAETAAREAAIAEAADHRAADAAAPAQAAGAAVAPAQAAGAAEEELRPEAAAEAAVVD